jgi:hypothetical protein
MTLASVSHVVTADAIILSDVAETTIPVIEPCNGPTIEATVLVEDLSGRIINETKVGNQVLIEGSAFMDCLQYPDDQQTMIFEVRNKEGITTFIAWQSVLQDSGGTLAGGVAWTPDEPGTYTVRFFPIVCLSCPMVLNKVVSYEVLVV